MAVVIFVFVSLTTAPGAASSEPITGEGYWLAAADGGVFAFGDAVFHGSLGGRVLNAPVVGMAATATGEGYWLAAADGGVFAFGDATFFGSLAGRPLDAAVVAMAAVTTDDGYWLTTADGCVTNFGSAVDHGGPCGGDVAFGIVDITSTGTGRGYFLIGAAGAVYPQGDASTFTGPASIIAGLQAPIVAADARGTDGIWQASADGGVFAFDTPFHGSMADRQLNTPVVGFAAHHQVTAPSLDAELGS